MSIKLKVLIGAFLLQFLGQTSTAQPTKIKPPVTHEDSLAAVDTVVINHNVYGRQYNWILFGPAFGASRFANKDASVGIDLHFRFKKLNWQAGFMRGGEYNNSFYTHFYNRDFNEIHVALGLKKGWRKSLIATYAGIGAIQGFYLDAAGASDGENFSAVSLYGSAQIIFKPIYDLGFGINAFADVNIRYSVYGIRLVAFLSNAYKGKMWR